MRQESKVCTNPDCAMINPQPLTNFNIRKASKSGLTSQCKNCRNASAHKRYELNKENILSKNRKWEIANPEKKKEANRLWRQNNVQKLRDKSETIADRFSRGKKSARERGLVWDLDIEQYKKLIDGKTCHYMGCKLSRTGHNLDRKNNELGYTLDNSVACCADCNRMKAHWFTYDEFVAICDLVRSMRLQNSGVK